MDTPTTMTVEIVNDGNDTRVTMPTLHLRGAATRGRTILETILVHNQDELDAALAAGRHPYCVGSGYFVAPSGAMLTAWENSQVTAWGNSQVTAWGNSQVTAWENSQVTAWGNSQVTAWGNSQVTARENSQVTARENSQVTAWGNSQVTARENSQVLVAGAARIIAGKYNAVTKVHPDAQITGGVLIEVPPITSAEAWCEFYGIEVTDGTAVLFKAVSGNYLSSWGFGYKPGSIPVAPDWDGGEKECGQGLHFAPSPGHAWAYDSSATRFMACPVALSQMAVHSPAQYPDKVKARGCCGPIWEVDRNGKPVATERCETAAGVIGG